MKLKNERNKGDYTSDSSGALYKKMKDHRKEFRVLIVSNTV